MFIHRFIYFFIAFCCTWISKLIKQPMLEALENLLLYIILFSLMHLFHIFTNFFKKCGNFNFLKPFSDRDVFFVLFLRYILRLTPIVYRLIGVALLGIFLIIPFYIEIIILTQRSHFGNVGQY